MEVNASQVRFRQGVAAAMMLQDPQEDVADLANVWDAFPGSQVGMRPLTSLGEKEQLLLVQPNGPDNGNNLLTGNMGKKWN